MRVHVMRAYELRRNIMLLHVAQSLFFFATRFFADCRATMTPHVFAIRAMSCRCLMLSLLAATLVFVARAFYTFFPFY